MLALNRKMQSSHRTKIVAARLRLAVCAALVCLQWGCREPAPVDEWPDNRQLVPRQSPVVMGPGDALDVKFFFTPELDVSQVVRPDGKISLQLIGEVTAQGKTPGQLKDELLQLYAPHLKDPEIVVLVRSLYDRRVFVGGQVLKPGVVEMPAEMTVTEAIMQAGGFDWRAAEPGSVLVIRHGGHRWKGYKVNLKPTMEGTATDCFFLQPKDIVHVPRTKITKADQWIEQHINKLIPSVFYFRVDVAD